MNTLDEIAKFYGTDKSSEHHNYCVKYEKYLPFNRYDKLMILEIGADRGASLKMWKDYYYRSQILGIDLQQHSKLCEEDRIKIELGSQNDPNFLDFISHQYGPFDMIVDDGSHMNSDVIFSFKHLFKSIKPGGIYVVEDACTSYWEYYEGGRNKPGTSIEYFKGVVDEVNFFGEIGENEDGSPGNASYGYERMDSRMINQFKRKGYNFIGTEIESLAFLNGIILIHKR